MAEASIKSEAVTGTDQDKNERQLKVQLASLVAQGSFVGGLWSQSAWKEFVWEGKDHLGEVSCLGMVVCKDLAEA